MTTQVLPDPPQAAAAAADAVEAAVRHVLASQPRCVLASAGGSTPGPVLALLGVRLADVAGRLTLTLVDERHTASAPQPWQALPADSNERMLHERWLAVAAHAPALASWNLALPLDAARDHLDAALPDPDVLLLGIGPDGHIASLFPNHPALGATGRVVAVDDSPKPPPLRLSYTVGALRRASHAVLLVTGRAKAEAAAAAVGGAPHLPTTSLGAAGGPHLRWVLDADAATSLETE